MGVVEVNHVLQGVDGRVAALSQVGIQVCFEIEEGDGQLIGRACHSLCRGQISRVNNDGARILHSSDGLIVDYFSFLLKSRVDLADDTDTCAPEAVGVKEWPIVAEEMAAAFGCCRVAWITPNHRAQHRCSISHRAPKWPYGVLVV